MINAGYNKATQPIVIIDSGYGGIEVYRKIREARPLEDIFLVIDNAFMPYGNKKEILLQRRVTKLIKKIKTLEPKQLVIACNTISSVAYESIISEIPYIDVIDVIGPTVDRVIDESAHNSKIALVATVATVRSQSYMKSLVRAPYRVDLIALESVDLAKAIETETDMKKVFNEEVEILTGETFDKLILGCTHYTKVKPLFHKKFPGVTIYDSAEILADNAVKSERTLFKKNGPVGKTTVILTEPSEVINKRFNENEQIENWIIK